VADRVSGLPIRSEQTFAEETAALFDEATGCMLVQYNHHGACCRIQARAILCQDVVAKLVSALLYVDACC
jgi:hypothetical protein